MKPQIDTTDFGSITVGGKRFEHDVIIDLKGNVAKRKKKLSKKVYGTSHTISLDEADYVYEKGATRIIIGAGQHGMVQLSPEAEEYFEQAGCAVDLLPTPRAISDWNSAKGRTVGLFHVTC